MFKYKVEKKRLPTNPLFEKICLLLSQNYAWLIQEVNVKKTRKYSELLWKLDVAGKVKSKHQSYIMKLIDKFPSKCGSFFSFV